MRNIEQRCFLSVIWVLMVKGGIIYCNKHFDNLDRYMCMFGKILWIGEIGVGVDLEEVLMDY